jgi:predicted RNA-binding protein (virulence factor B family)
MAAKGKYNILQILRLTDIGIYLDGEEGGEILMPKRYVPENASAGDKLEVFIYLDSEDRLIATTEKPLAQVGEVAMLQVKAVNSVGAFLDWGLM